MYDPAKVAVAFSKLFQTYPSFQAGDADEALRVYFEAVEPYATGDILDAVQNFLNGSAPGVNPNFAPPAPAVASECRRVMNLRLESEDRIRRRRPSLPPPDIGEAERERVKAGFAALIAAHEKQAEGHMEAVAALARERSEAEIKRRVETGEFIEMPGSSYPISQTLAKSLGYVTGDAEGEAA